MRKLGRAEMAVSDTAASARAVKDTAKLFSARMAAAAFSVFFTGWLLRLIPTEQLAVWPIAVALAAAVEALASLGMGDTFVRRIPRHLAEGKRDEAGALLRTGLLLNIVACAVVTALLTISPTWTARHLIGDASQTAIISSLVIMVFLNALEKRFRWGLTATQQFGRMAVLDLFGRVARMPLAVALYLHSGLSGLLLAFAIVPAISCAATLALLWPYMRRAHGFAPVGELLSFSAAFYGVSVLGFLRGRAQYLVVGVLTSPEVLGLYFVASKVSDYLRELGGFGIGAVTPKLAERGGTSPEERPRILRECSRYLLLVMLPMHLGIAVLAVPIVRIYAGADYASAGIILSVLAIYAWFELAYSLHRAHIQVYAPPVHLLVLQAVSAGLDLLTMAVLVLLLGALGAAVAKLITYAALSVVAAAFLARTVPLRYDLQALNSALVAGTALSLVCYAAAMLAPRASIAVVTGTLLGTAAYIIALRGRVSVRDLDLLFGALPGRVRDGRPVARLRSMVSRWLMPEPEVTGGAAGDGAT